MEAKNLLVVVAFILGSSVVSGESNKNDPELSVLKQTLQSRYSNMKILDVTPAPVAGLYEVFTGVEVLYADKSGDYLFSGSLRDTRTKQNLTVARVNERNAIAFASLPIDRAIKIVKGSGTRRLAVFSDPDCPYCRRLEENLRSISDVTMYVFLYPLTTIHPQAEVRSRAIWCSADPKQAWADWMLDRKEPQSAAACEDPISATLRLGEELYINATPTLYFENGTRAAGALSSSDLESRLSEAKKDAHR